MLYLVVGQKLKIELHKTERICIFSVVLQNSLGCNAVGDTIQSTGIGLFALAEPPK